MEKRRLLVNGRAVHYLSGGSAANQVIILLHGYGMTGWVYKKLGLLLSLNHFVVIPDLPGFGKSDGLPEAELGQIAENLNDFLEGLGLSKVIVIGHSMGGGVAIQLGWLFPEKVEKLILLNSSGAPVKRNFWGWVIAASNKTLKSLHKPFGAFKVSAAFSLNCITHPLWMLKTFQMVVNCDQLAELPSLGMLMKVIWSERDEYYPLSVCSAFCSAASVKPLVILGEGHDWMILNPKKANQVINSLI